MEVKIGVTDVAREISIDTELDADGVQELVQAAVSGGGLFTLADAKGRRVVVPADRLAYVDISSSSVGMVGFRS